jgi:hypothetical protein
MALYNEQCMYVPSFDVAKTLLDNYGADLGTEARVQICDAIIDEMDTFPDYLLSEDNKCFKNTAKGAMYSCKNILTRKTAAEELVDTMRSQQIENQRYRCLVREADKEREQERQNRMHYQLMYEREQEECCFCTIS